MPGPKSNLEWNIVRKAENGLYYLQFVEFEAGCSGTTVFEQIQQLCLPQRKAFSDRVSSLLCSQVVYTGTFVKVRQFDFSLTHDLILEGRRFDWMQGHRSPVSES
jgi:hypothetical protein